MGVVLYEIGVSSLIKGIRSDIILALFVLIGTLVSYWRFRRDYDLKEKGKNKITSIGGCLIFLIIVSTIIGQYKEYDLLKEAYKTNSCLYVEGVIYDFRGHPDTAQWYEEFWVDGVFFSYTPYEQTQGYYHPRGKKGVLTGNGQKVKIGYVPIEVAREVKNKIVYIEQLE